MAAGKQVLTYQYVEDDVVWLESEDGTSYDMPEHFEIDGKEFYITPTTVMYLMPDNGKFSIIAQENNVVLYVEMILDPGAQMKTYFIGAEYILGVKDLTTLH